MQYIGAHNISTPHTYDYIQDLGSNFDPYTCCAICNNPGEGPFSSCLLWEIIGGDCKLLINSKNYMQPNCQADGKEPATIDVIAKTYPQAVGGTGNCAGAVTVVNV